MSPTRITSYYTQQELDRKTRQQEEIRRLLHEQMEERRWKQEEERHKRLVEDQLEEERLARERQQLDEEYRREILSREGYNEENPPPVPVSQTEKPVARAGKTFPKPESQSQIEPVSTDQKVLEYAPSKYLSGPFASDDRLQRLRDDMSGRQQNLQNLITKLKEESQGLALQKQDALREFDQMREDIRVRNQQQEHVLRHQNLASHYHTVPWRSPPQARIDHESRFLPLSKVGLSVVSGPTRTASYLSIPGPRQTYNGVDSPEVKMQLSKLDGILDLCMGVGEVENRDEGEGRRGRGLDEIREAEKDMDDRQPLPQDTKLDVEESAKFPEQS